MAQALSQTSARILILERGDFVPQEERKLGSGRGLEEAPLPRQGTLARRSRQGVHALHALRRRREHEVLGQRAVSAAPRGLPGDRARRRRVAGVADRLRHARAVLRARRAPVPRARRGRHRSDRSRRAALIRTARSRTRRKWRRSSASCEQQGLHPSPLPLGLLQGRRGRRLHPLQHVQFVRRASCTRRAKPTSAACARRLQRPNVTLWTNTHRAAPDHRSVRAPESRPSRSSGTARRFASKRRSSSSSCGAVNSAALLLRSATDKHPDGLANSSGLVGARYMAHLATMMQGFHPLRKNSTVFQKTVAINDFYLRGPATPSIRSGRSSRRGGRTASWRRPSCRGFRCGRTKRGCRAASTGS